MHEDHLFRIPESLSYEEGALVEPLSVALHAVKRSGVRLGKHQRRIRRGGYRAARDNAAPAGIRR